jgi:hypothetical protein
MGCGQADQLAAGVPRSGIALSGDPLVVACDLLMRFLACEHLGKLGHAGAH